MVFNVAKIASARASSTKSLTISLRVAGPLVYRWSMVRSCVPAGAKILRPAGVAAL